MSIKAVFAEGLKTQYVDSRYVEELKAECLRRESPVSDAIDIDVAFVDLPGMIFADRKLEEFDLGEFRLQIPASDVETFYLEMGYAKPKFLGSYTFYKIHGWLDVIVLEATQFVELSRQIAVRLDSIRIVADEEFRRLTKTKEKLVSDGFLAAPKPTPKNLLN